MLRNLNCTLFQGPAMVQTVRHRHLIAEAWLRPQANLNLCVICGGQIGPSTGFPPRTSHFLVSIISPMLHTHSIHLSPTLYTRTNLAHRFFIAEPRSRCYGRIAVLKAYCATL